MTTLKRHPFLPTFYLHTLSSTSYFNYKVDFRCGVPSVTLEGEKSDWIIILSRLPKLESFGSEPASTILKLLSPRFNVQDLHTYLDR
jgi:Domain of unknown function (DUF4419)